MAVDITIRWAGPGGATGGSTYKIERSFDLTNWTELAAARPATAPYASPAATLANAATYGATTLDLTGISGTVSGSGVGYVGKAHVQWTGKTGNQLTGVTWQTGHGAYAAGTGFVEAHESYADAGVDGFNYTVFYRLTHQNGGQAGKPGFVIHYLPPAPASADHCVLLVVVATDVGGMKRRVGVSVACYLQDDSAFDPFGGQADANRIADNMQTTGVDGAVAFQLWKDSALAATSGGTVPQYAVALGTNEPGSEQTFTLTGVPDNRDWLLLSWAV